MKLAILGAGAWGTALAVALAGRHDVALWLRDAAVAQRIARDRSNPRYLPDVPLPPALRVTADLDAALAGAEAAIVAVPTPALRETLARVADWRGAAILACKGFEPRTGRLPHEVVAEVLGPDAAAGVLSGPSFAAEVARGLPTAVTLACSDAGVAARFARELHGPRLRVYSWDDVVGVEVAGATKNVIAIAAGICDGLSLGANARAALITRGLAEVSRLGRRLGGRMETFLGLAGAGDLVLTCTGDLSRNRTVGRALASGRRLEDVLAGLGHVAEGVHTAREIDRLADGLAVDMPITRAVRAVLDGELSAAGAATRLLERDSKAEF